MADILIKNMEMPKDNKRIFLCIEKDGEVGVFEEKKLTRFTEAQELPPHGRLITDIDVKALLHSGLSLDTDSDIDHVCGLIDGLPTIVEATE